MSGAEEFVAGEVAAHGRSRWLRQEALAKLGETEDLRRGGETGDEREPERQGETPELRRGSEAREPENAQAEPGDVPVLRRDDEMQAGER